MIVKRSYSRFLQPRGGREILMLRFSASQHSVPSVPGWLRAQRDVRVPEPDFLHAVRGKQARALSPKNTLEQAAIGGARDCLK